MNTVLLTRLQHRTARPCKRPPRSYPTQMLRRTQLHRRLRSCTSQGAWTPSKRVDPRSSGTNLPYRVDNWPAGGNPSRSQQLPFPSTPRPAVLLGQKEPGSSVEKAQAAALQPLLLPYGARLQQRQAPLRVLCTPR